MMMAEQQWTSTTAKEQSAFIGRMMTIPLLSLGLLGLWIVISSVLTPLNAETAMREQLLTLRWVLIGCGVFVIGVTDLIAFVRLLHWDTYTFEMTVDSDDSDEVQIDASAES